MSTVFYFWFHYILFYFYSAYSVLFCRLRKVPKCIVHRQQNKSSLHNHHCWRCYVDDPLWNRWVLQNIAEKKWFPCYRCKRYYDATVLRCTLLYCDVTVLRCSLLYCDVTVLRCTLLYCDVTHSTILWWYCLLSFIWLQCCEMLSCCFVLYCTDLYWSVVWCNCTVLCYSVLCSVLLCFFIVL